MNYDRLVNFDINAGQLYDVLSQLSTKHATMLKADRKVVMMEGYAESGLVCSHLKLRNPTNNVVVFVVRKPSIHALSVNPKMALVMPKGEIWVHVQFGGRVVRIPDDGVLLLSVYQASLNSLGEEKVDCVKTASRIARRYWSDAKNQGKDVEHVLHIPLAWKAKKDNPLHEEHIDVFRKELEAQQPKSGA